MESNNGSDVPFNNGFITALALFYAHRFLRYSFTRRDLRIYAGSDHLINMQMPENLDPDLKNRVDGFIDKVMSSRYEELPEEKAEELFSECLEILKELDKKLFNLDVVVNYM